MAESLQDLLPPDYASGLFIGRALSSDGPCVILIREGRVFDLTEEVATVSGAIDRRHFSGGRELGAVEQGLPEGWTLLSPADLQCVKACVVTFAVSAIEHKSILEVAHWLEARGWRVTRLPVDRGGRVDPASVEEALMARASIVSVMAANNEIGVIQPLRQIRGPSSAINPRRVTAPIPNNTPVSRNMVAMPIRKGRSAPAYTPCPRRAGTTAARDATAITP